MTDKMETEEFLEDQENRKKREEAKRAVWDRPIEFFLNVLGFIIGLGNLWRFPYLCYKNGGGAFLIPYILVAVFCGLPIVFLEMSMGQFTKRSALGAWNMVPIIKGVACTALFISWYYMSYMMVIMSWIVFYFVHCFTTGPLPWSTCDNWWNTNSCIPILSTQFNETNNSTDSMLHRSDNGTTTSSTGEFWTKYVVRQTDGIHDMGSFSNTKMILCFLASWTLCYLCVVKGIRTSGKVAYVTVIAPYIMLTVLLVRGLTLEGAGDGIWYYITPRFEELAKPQVWLDAGGQILYSLAVCCLALYGFGSHNKFNVDCYKYAIAAVGACCATSFFVGFIVFSYIGHLALLQGKNITEVAESGPGLVFEVFPAGLTFLPAPQVWSAVFFLTLTFVAIDSAFGTVEGVSSFLEDMRPRWFADSRAHICRLSMSAFPFLLGIPMLMDGGVYLLELINAYGTSGICFLLCAFFEIVGIAWIYGVDKFFDNVKQMIGYRPNIFVKYCYLYFAPAISMSIFIAYCTQYSPLKKGDYEYPGWANAIGWLLSLSVLAGIPILAIKSLMEGGGSLKQRWKHATTSRFEEHEYSPDAKERTTELQL